MRNMHAMYAHESTMTFRIESLTPEQRWQKTIQDGLQIKIFHEKSGLIRPVALEDSENLTQNQNFYLDRGWCRAEMSWSSVRGDTAQNQRVDLEVTFTEEKQVIDEHLTGTTPVAPDAFAADMHSAAFTHRSDAGAVIDLQKKVFLEKVTKRRKLKVEGISLQQMQALTQSLRYFEELESITINDFRCGDKEARAFVEALATTPIKKISGKTKDESSLLCLVKAMAVASKTLKITHLDLATEIYWAQLRASGAEAIAVFLKSTTTLVNLDLRENFLCNVGVKELAKALKENRTLKRLNLARNGINVEGVQAIAVFLKSTTTLVNLDLRENFLCNVGVKVLAEALKENRTLKRLNLADNGIGVEGVQALRRALKTNKTLEHLELGGGFEPTGDFDGAEAIAAACRANRRIRHPSAVLSEASDGSEEQALKSPFEAAVRIKGLAAELRLNRIITELNLSKKNICDEQLKALAEAFRVNKTIKLVHLFFNQIGDEGVKALADAFLVNKTIERVSLGGNQIGDEGVKALASAMEINETITEVQLKMKEAQLAMLSDEGRQALKDIQLFCDRNKALQGFGKGKINYQEDLAWMKGQPPFGSKGKFGKGKFGNQKGKTSGKGKDLR